ncbi:hypothetical protein [Mycolicibacterium holsaticum]|uniref:hypothetical protein n=1 Tax=Mycolicibacterium holsaticum TaxID=152142 RepID=UPI001C7CC009|nr:hypothetical protein [Mycolicibacterium holsaticum]MDA4109122.1 hypothetical protein [Mycolicibacterium holsaticum DSM 44478 = JCM 12374]QZA11525.1 hypothetical protein K3U96_20315 [Mycolicibacterium holsaticum DSM 44478 = JCM 12374]UNC10987.1 hypothetical protein H5U41_06515 [Mycolicibacterium holsaticum DSM 44478 = JCM 12374]
MITGVPEIGLLTGAFALVAGLCAAAISSASPTAGAYPEIDGYQPASDIQNYKVVGKTGVWFTSPLGVRCAIEDDGSYGCSGDLPGAPPGSNEVAWFVGDPFPRIYHAEAPRFSAPSAHMLLTRLTAISYRGSTCAVTAESTVYCIHGDNPDSQLMVTTTAPLRGRDATRAD